MRFARVGITSLNNLGSANNSSATGQFMLHLPLTPATFIEDVSEEAEDEFDMGEQVARMNTWYQ